MLKPRVYRVDVPRRNYHNAEENPEITIKAGAPERYLKYAPIMRPAKSATACQDRLYTQFR
jgi:hypothetical protein